MLQHVAILALETKKFGNKGVSEVFRIDGGCSMGLVFIVFALLTSVTQGFCRHALKPPSHTLELSA